MYERYWGLTQSPFRTGLDECCLYEGRAHEEALARLYFTVEHQRRCALMTGPAGTGKSLLLRLLAKQLRRTQRRFAAIDLGGLDREEFLWRCAASLQADLPAADSSVPLWRTLEEHLRLLRLANVQAVLLLDRADHAAEDVLAAIRRLLDVAQETSCWTTVILAGRSVGQGANFRDVADSVDLLIELRPWDARETADYVRQSLSKAGGRQDIFESAALAALFECSRGVPRTVNRLCDLALLAGMGEGRKTIDAATVRRVAGELQIGRGSDRATNRPAAQPQFAQL